MKGTTWNRRLRRGSDSVGNNYSWDTNFSRLLGVARERLCPLTSRFRRYLCCTLTPSFLSLDTLIPRFCCGRVRVCREIRLDLLSSPLSILSSSSLGLSHGGAMGRGDPTVTIIRNYHRVHVPYSYREMLGDAAPSRQRLKPACFFASFDIGLLRVGPRRASFSTNDRQTKNYSGAQRDRIYVQDSQHFRKRPRRRFL